MVPEDFDLPRSLFRLRLHRTKELIRGLALEYIKTRRHMGGNTKKERVTSLVAPTTWRPPLSS